MNKKKLKIAVLVLSILAGTVGAGLIASWLFLIGLLAGAFVGIIISFVVSGAPIRKRFYRASDRWLPNRLEISYAFWGIAMLMSIACWYLLPVTLFAPRLEIGDLYAALEILANASVLCVFGIYTNEDDDDETRAKTASLRRHALRAFPPVTVFLLLRALWRLAFRRNKTQPEAGAP